jgi:hypothetical protein
MPTISEGRQQANRTWLIAISTPRLRLHSHWTVIVTMIAVRMMQMTVHQIVHMVSMRHCLMTAARSVNVILVVRTAIMVRRASIGIRGRHFQDMLIDMIAVNMV